MRIRNLLVLFLLIGLKFQTQAQDDIEKLKEKAYDYFSYEEYEEALPMLLKIDSLKPNDPKVNYEIGICEFHSLHQERALPYFAKAKRLGYKIDPGHHGHENVTTELYLSDAGKYVSDDLDFNLARAYHLHHSFDSAEAYYRAYEEKLDKESKQGKKDFEIMERFVSQCEIGKEMVKDSVNIIVENLGPKINSEFGDYVPVISADESTLIFTSRRANPDNKASKRDPDRPEEWMEDIFISTKDTNDEWSEPKSISKNINTKEHDACIGLSPDGQKLFIYINDHHATGNIYVSNLNGNEWSEPEKMQEGINGKHSWEGSASITADEKILFFTSDRKGGAGGKDIYMAKRLPNSQWGVPTLLPAEVNTSFDEDAPFIHPDGVTLYFSSKGHKNMGGYDIFKSVYDPEKETWSKAENIGYPINTADDDLFFVFSVDGKRAYFSSHHEDSYGDQDIYVMHRPYVKEKSLIVLKGLITSATDKSPLGATITVTDNESGNIVGIYNSNSYTGKYIIILPPGKNYGISVNAQGYVPFSENVDLPDTGEFYEKEKNIELNPIAPGSIMILKNVFFDYKKSSLRKSSFFELDKYATVLNEHPKVYVEIAGHTDSIGSAGYNNKLSQERAQSVVDYLASKGVDAKRLKAVGYGKKHPIAPNSNPDGSDNPHGRQLNRRTELIISGSPGSGNNWKQHYDN